MKIVKIIYSLILSLFGCFKDTKYVKHPYYPLLNVDEYGYIVIEYRRTWKKPDHWEYVSTYHKSEWEHEIEKSISICGCPLYEFENTIYEESTEGYSDVGWD